jgi:lysophospholipase L1-like esterase
MNGKWTQFVALGDSLTEGVGDIQTDGRPRGWADRFADEIALRQGGLRYANLAVRGKITSEVVTTQLRPAIALAPDLASVVVGMNDMIRPRVNLARVCQLFDYLVASLARTGAVVLTATLPDPGPISPLPAPVRRRFTERIRRFNEHVHRSAERHDAHCLDLAGFASRDAAGWSEDRLHPGPYGHQRLADEFLHLLTGKRSETVLDPPVVVSASQGIRDQVQWVLHKAGPWLWRHVTRQAARQPFTAKFPSYRLLGTAPA